MRWVMGVLIFGICAVRGSVTGSSWAEDLLVADFESTTYGEWVVEGGAFGMRPAEGTLEGQMPVSGFRGKRLVNSFHGGDGSVGTLTSPPFAIERKSLFFLIGGGRYPGETCMDLLIEGEVVRTATGPNNQPGGSERLTWQSWDVSEFRNQHAVLRIVDIATGGWGHISVDHIIQCDEPPVKELMMRMKVDRRYLNLPVKNGAEMRRMRVMVGDRTVREFDIELAEGEPDFWVFLDMSMAPFPGSEIEIRADGMPRDSIAFDAIVQEDEIRGTGNLYREKHRPQFHFTSRRGWINDPNGLVWHDDEYHLYYQHNPYGRNWGNMHWGHAVSTDLVHWQELPIALYPREYGDWCFSGSAVVDKDNTAGFKTGSEDVIVSAYTSTGRGECIAYSNDRGRTFAEYEGNPVVPFSGRDPKLIWHAPTGQWVMAVYNEQEGKENGIAFHTSADLKHWEYQSRIVEYYECPDLFALPVDGDTNRMKWIVYGAHAEYSIGEFDGKEFKTELYKLPLNRGNCFYASQTYNNIPSEDGRRIMVGWGTVGIPDMPFNQMMTFPCSLTLHETDDGLRLFAQPVKEIEKLHANTHTIDDCVLGPDTNPLGAIRGELFHIIAEIEIGDASTLSLMVDDASIVYNVDKQELTCFDKVAPMKPANGRIHLELLVDRASVEIFGNQGAVYMPMGVIAPEGNRSLALHGDGAAKALRLAVHELASVWTPAEVAQTTGGQL